ncbi:MAG TPA: DNA mismatch repair protein MutS [Candidatus Binatia bacterium]|nr:DNA mismatch repair protein MutS [Candidatus Binatia bacterium]
MSTRTRATPPHRLAESAPVREPTIELDDAGNTPILREYRAVKAQHPDALVLARLGDFYELFGHDAELAAPLLEVTLTGRGFGSAGRLPMCGVPHHAAAGYVRKLLDAGHRVVLWDQVGEVIEGRLVRREVTRILSPGTAVDADLLEATRVARLVALQAGEARVGVAALDLAGGELTLVEVPGGLDSAALRDELARLDVAELLLAEPLVAPEGFAPGATRSGLPTAFFDPGRAQDRLRAVTGAATLTGLGVDGMAAAIRAAGAVLAYCERSRVLLEPGAIRVSPRRPGEVMMLDAPTLRTLELLRPLGSGPSLAGLLDRTRTPMGSRLLRRRLREPLTDLLAIDRRLDSVAALVADRPRRHELGHALASVRDLERLVGRAVQGLATPRDLGAIRDAGAVLPRLASMLEGLPGELAGLGQTAIPPAIVSDRLGQLLVDDPPPSGREGGFIREGADSELDGLHASAAEARDFIGGLEARERERTGIRSLRVGYNRVFGYYLEVPHAHRDAVPGDYLRKQTLVGAERYITPQLKDHETVVLHARERAVARELELLNQCSRLVTDHAAPLLACAEAVAIADVAQSLGGLADEERWVRPTVDGSTVTDIVEGRHPLVERALGHGAFVANDTALDAAQRIVILTGPNMAGKSTYLRQVALITLLAQVGSFVPARRARIGVCDRIFTRVGAQDDLSAGLSTFMVEMAETAAILRQATQRSLLVLDEIGRGTSTYDGLSIAQALVEHLHDSPRLGCRTLFATHYHELTALADRLPGVANARVEVVEEGETVTFLHRIRPGGADRSYGIQVARLAGLPASVLARAREILGELERRRPLEGEGPGPAQLDLGFMATPAHPVLDELAGLDLDGLTPRQALSKLAELQERAGR